MVQGLLAISMCIAQTISADTTETPQHYPHVKKLILNRTAAKGLSILLQRHTHGSKSSNCTCIIPLRRGYTCLK